MKTTWYLFLLYLLQGCYQMTSSQQVAGLYRNPSDQILDLRQDSTFIWYNSPMSTHFPSRDYCKIISSGKWRSDSSNYLELMSSERLESEGWVKYDLQLSSSGSDDSLYFEVLPAERDLAVQYLWFIDARSIQLGGKNRISKKEVFKFKKTYSIYGLSLILLRDNRLANSPWGGDSFTVFEKSVSLEKNNHIRVVLPDFNSCKLYFQPVRSEIVVLRNENELKWHGSVWKRISPQDTVRTK